MEWILEADTTAPGRNQGQKELRKSLKNNNKIKDKTLYTLCMFSELSHQALPRWLGSKESTYNAGYVGSIPGSEDSLDLQGISESLKKCDALLIWATFWVILHRYVGVVMSMHSTQAIQLGYDLPGTSLIQAISKDFSLKLFCLEGQDLVQCYSKCAPSKTYHWSVSTLI